VMAGAATSQWAAAVPAKACPPFYINLPSPSRGMRSPLHCAVRGRVWGRGIHAAECPPFWRKVAFTHPIWEGEVLGGEGRVQLGTAPHPSFFPYMGTSLIRNLLPVGPYSRAMPRALWWS